MTEQEAIEIISNTPFMSSMKKTYSADDRTPQDDPLYSPLYEALQMAIHALEDNECLKEKCRKLYNKLTETLKNTQREHECLIEELKSRTAELQRSYRKVHLIYAEYQMQRRHLQKEKVKRMDKYIEFLRRMNAEALKTELIIFFENDEYDNSDFLEQLVEFINDDLSRAEG